MQRKRKLNCAFVVRICKTKVFSINMKILRSKNSLVMQPILVQWLFSKTEKRRGNSLKGASRQMPLAACDIYKEGISVSSLIRNVVDDREIEITIILTTSTGGSPRRSLHGFVNHL